MEPIVGQHAYLLNSQRWTGFLESTAIGLSLHFKLVRSDGTVHAVIPTACSRCRPSRRASVTSSVQLDLPFGFAIEATECTGAHVRLQPSLEVRAQMAGRLLTSFLTALHGEISGGHRSVELSALRQMNRIVISLFHGEKRAAQRALDLILSALIILLDAQGSWLSYEEDGQEHLLIKGDEVLVRRALKSDDVDHMAMPLPNGRVPGRMGVVCAADPVHAAALLPLLTDECVIVFEVQHLFQLVQARLTQLIGAIQSAVLVLDRSGSVLFANPAAERLLTSTPLGLVGQPSDNLPGPWTAAVEARPMAPIRGYMDPLGERFVDWQVNPLVENGRTEGWLLLVDDQTDQQRWQFAAAKADRLATAVSLTDGLVRGMRRPLLAMQSLVQLIAHGNSPEVSRAYARQVEQQLGQAVDLMNQFASLTRTTSALVVLELGTLLEELTPVLQTLAKSYGAEVTLSLQPIPSVFGNALQLTDLVMELVRNAGAAMDEPGGKIQISLMATEEGVRLTCADNGTGLSPEVMEHMFRPFFTTREVGKGLGLAAVQATVHHHGGWISAANRSGCGAIFTICLPAIASVPGVAFPVQVLVATMDPMLRYPVEQVLRSEGIATIAGGDLGEILALGREHQPKVILLDEWTVGSLDLPVITESLPLTHLLAISSSADSPSPAANGLRVLHRPLDYRRLVAEVQAILQSSKEGVSV